MQEVRFNCARKVQVIAKSMGIYLTIRGKFILDVPKVIDLLE